MTSRDEILAGVAAGKITPAEAEVLLVALPRREGRLWAWVFNPVERLSTGQALGASVVLGLVQLAVSQFGVRFDGALDVHFPQSPVGLPWAVLDFAVGWIVTAGVLWGSARLSAPRGRYVDFLASVGVSRFPLVLIGLVLAAMGPRLREVGSTPQDLLSLPVITSVLVSLPLVGWSITLLVMGYRTASGLHGAKLTSSLIGGLLVAEVLSKVLVGLY